MIEARPKDNPEPLAVPPITAAKMIGIGQTKMRILIREKEIPSVKIGTRVVVPVESLRSFIASRAAGISAPI